MDWNWFFTAVAQCSAAIVGFFGGFIINKILNSENEFNSLNLIIHDLENKIDNQKRLLSIRKIGWYNSKMRELVKYRVDYENIVLKGKGEVDFSCIDEFNYSPYDSISEIKNEISEDWNTYKGQPFQNTSIHSLLPSSPKELYSQLEEERELIDREFVSTRALNDEIDKKLIILNNFKINSGSYKFIIWTIIVLFFFGVIYPLTFTPSIGEIQLCKINEIPQVFFSNLFSIKGFILFTISFIFTFLLSYFLYKLKTMRFNSEKINYLKKHVAVETFSQYFKNLIEFDEY